MGSVQTIVLCSILLVLLPWSVTSSFNLAPVFSPIFEDLCKHVECGKGTCKPSNSSIGYVCECEPGWKQTRLEHDDDFKFLPCVIPNCTLDFSCIEAPSPAPAKEKRTNDSIFDTCHWADCGGGTCNKTSSFTHKCECNEGYYNLLNVTAFPCFKECALGMDCSRLGINVMNNSSAPPSLPENGGNQEDLCKHVECGKGTCKLSNSSIGYVCECEPGWKQTRPEHDDFKFLPCVIPNCTLDFSCIEAPSPAPAKEKRTNDSFFDTCHWADCGGGTCNKTSLYTHKCECNKGYYNLLNVTAFPCFKECALGWDCSRLGINVTNSSSSATPSLPEKSGNQASSASNNDLNWKILITLSLAFILWK